MNIAAQTRLVSSIIALAIVAAGSLLTYAIHRPQIGMDDANITQVYADNIAAGRGYVYNGQGERVEGSTSPGWTLLNAAAFALFNTPEPSLTILTFILTFLIVRLSLRLSADLHARLGLPGRGSAALVGGGFLLSPALFTWCVWSLMDTALWVYCVLASVAAAFDLIVGEDGRPAPSILRFSAFAVALPLVRPEGMLMSFALLLTVSAAVANDGATQHRRPLVVTWFVWASSVAAGFVLRLAYFGVPLPNTFYAKVSTGVVTQAIAGASYVISYFSQSAVATMSIFALIALTMLPQRRLARAASPRPPWIAALFAVVILTILGTYVGVGGDHFGSFRQLQVLIPLNIVLGSVGASWLIQQCGRLGSDGPAGTAISRIALAAAAAIVILPTLASYVQTGGTIDHEFRLAEDGRLVGERLNEIEWLPTLGVIAAGGIARTYEGHIYDLMGLNWVEMARAVRDKSGGVRAHASFSADVFYRFLPEVILPGRRSCVPPENFAYYDLLLKGLLTDQEFHAEYVYVCFKDLTFYARRSVRDRLAASGFPISSP